MILDDIIAHKEHELLLLKEERPLEALIPDVAAAPAVKDFKQALSRPRTQQGREIYRVIAEIKQASPSKGIMCRDFDPVAIARTYEACGAAAISVVTDRRFFQGDMEYLMQVRRVTSIPLLNKDFIIDPYQIYRARISGADAVLLIAAILSSGQLSGYLKLVKDLAMSALVEVHTAEELARVLATDAEIIGINNRNLRTFEVNIDTTRRLLPSVPAGRIVVSESGIATREVMRDLAGQGVHAFLIGEALMQSEDRGTALRLLLN